jgi:hypothetical protein
MQRESKDGFVLGFAVDLDAMIDREQRTCGGLFMTYVLEFLGFLAVAILLAASPLLVRTVEYLRPRLRQSSRETDGYESFQPRSDERAEIRNEIRRMTAILEVDRRGAQHDPHS